MQHDLTSLTTEQIVDLGIALVPEGRRLFPKLTVEENLALGAFRPTARAQIKPEPRSLLRDLPAAAPSAESQLAGSMSGGEQQMLALGRALMLAPKILLVDEPSVGLAPILVSRTIDKIKELKERLNLTVLMAEQNFNQAIRIADRGYVIVHGKIAFAGQLRRRAQQQRPDPEVLSGALSSAFRPRPALILRSGAKHRVSKDEGGPSDLGLARDRHALERKSGKPDLRPSRRIASRCSSA